MGKKTIRTLVIEDNPDDFEIIGKLLERNRRSFELVHADSVRSARKLMSKEAFDAVLLDQRLPGEDGLALLRSQNGRGRLPPVIMLTGQDDVVVAKDAIKLGAHDYVPKGSMASDRLGNAIHDAVEADAAVREPRAMGDMQRLAYVDQLTGLYNRRYLNHTLEKECRRALRYGHHLSCLMIDLDDFKYYNDSYGHLEGDMILRQVALAISSSMRDTDSATRYGGDEFFVTLPETPQDNAVQVAERLRLNVLTMKLVVHNFCISASVSIGVFTPASEQQISPEVVLHCTDRALHRAKSQGKNSVSIYDSPGIAAVTSGR